jgi:hypothetical protein
MIKKFILLSLVASQLMVSCSSDDSPTDPTKDLTLEEQIANLVKQPYSKLTPTEQKAKLEVEANEMLVQLDKSKSSSAIEAVENLNRLLDISTVDIFSGKNDNEVEDILNISGAYGIYTWNSTKKSWDKTASTTELKFVFPAKESATTNNAVFSSKGVSSDVKIEFYDSYNSTNDEDVYDNLFLPSSSDATLTIDNKEAATFTQTAKYSSKNQSPDEFAYKMSLNDGYVWEMSGSKATANTSKATLTYNGKSLVSFNAGSSAEIDKLIDNDELVQYRGKANGLFTLMDNFVIVADIDLAEMAKGEAAVETNFPRPDRNTKTFYTDLNIYNQKSAEAGVLNSNKNAKLILVSKKDGTKIADIVYRTAPGFSFKTSEYETWVPDATNVKYGGSWVFDWNNGVPKGTAVQIQEYDEVLYLKFSDNTEVEMSAYFSTGFEKLQTKFDDFIAAFNKQ